MNAAQSQPDTPIADMVAVMLSAGVAADMIALAVRTAEIVSRCMAPLQRTVASSTERTRRWRERKRSDASQPSHPVVEAAPIAAERPYVDPNQLAFPFTIVETDTLECAAAKVVMQENVTASRDSEVVHSLSKDLQVRRFKKERGSTRARAPVRAPQAPLPAGWRPSDEAWLYGVSELGESAEKQLQRFLNWNADRGTLSSDWDAKWRLWVDRAIEHEARRREPGLPLPPQQVACNTVEIRCGSSFAGIYPRLIAALGRDICASWFSAATLALDRDTAVVCFPSEFARGCVDGRYRGELLTAIQASNPEIKQLRLVANRPAAA